MLVISEHLAQDTRPGARPTETADARSLLEWQGMITVMICAGTRRLSQCREAPGLL